jgi:hypothetical protein
MLIHMELSWALTICFVKLNLQSLDGLVQPSCQPKPTLVQDQGFYLTQLCELLSFDDSFPSE